MDARATCAHFHDQKMNYVCIVVSAIPKFRGKVVRVLQQFSPETWDTFRWHALESPKRMFVVVLVPSVCLCVSQSECVCVCLHIARDCMMRAYRVNHGQPTPQNTQVYVCVLVVDFNAFALK